MLVYEDKFKKIISSEQQKIIKPRQWWKGLTSQVKFHKGGIRNPQYFSKRAKILKSLKIET